MDCTMQQVRRGKEILSCQYDGKYDFSEGLAKVCIYKDGEPYYGFVNNKGKQVVSCKYSNASDFKNGVSRVMHNGEWMFIDTNGKRVE